MTTFVSIGRWNKRLEEADMSALNEVALTCFEMRSALNKKCYVNFDTIRCIRSWQDVVRDDRIVADLQEPFLLSSPEDWVNLTEISNKTRVQVVATHPPTGRRFDIRLWSNHAELLHPALAKNIPLWKTFMAVHRVPFHVLASINKENNFLDIDVLQWDIDTYLKENGVRLSSDMIDRLVDHPNVFFPPSMMVVGGEQSTNVYALMCPNTLTTEEQLRLALDNGVQLECCALFTGLEESNKRHKVK
jgi:hypothetical protein